MDGSFFGFATLREGGGMKRKKTFGIKTEIKNDVKQNKTRFVCHLYIYTLKIYM